MVQALLEVMTIGYEGLTPPEFFGILERCNVSTLVDVRELPISRRRGFAKSVLADALEKRGISYVHAPALGCPREIRHGYRGDCDWQRYTHKFKRYLGTQADALQDLAQLIAQERCCLMCFEEDFNFCHRKYVAEAVAPLVDGLVRVHHLTGPIEGRVVRFDLAAA